jgi:hypothetical protein
MTLITPSKLSARSSRHHLKLFYCFECDVDRGTLSAELLAEETVVVVAAVETHVVEDSALTREVDLVAVRTLRDADTGRECQQVFKLSSEDRCRSHCGLIHGGADFGFHRVDSWRRRDRNGLCHFGNFKCEVSR